MQLLRVALILFAGLHKKITCDQIGEILPRASPEVLAAIWPIIGLSSEVTPVTMRDVRNPDRVSITMPLVQIDRYGSDALARGPQRPRRVASTRVEAALGLVVEEVETGWVGAVVGVEKSGGMALVSLEDRRGQVRAFRLGGGFWVDGQPVVLVPPSLGQVTPRRTASGSRAVSGARARIARASRIWVEGRHDAELVDRVWGEDLALQGVVVEMLDGIDNLLDRAVAFAPSPGRRLGVLVDHLVGGSKESRIAADVVAQLGQTDILILGHPYVDVWQAIKPSRIGLAAWPVVARGVEWKVGLLRQLSWPCANQEDIAAAWKRLLGQVRDFRDLDPALLGRVEELIDFVTA